MSVQFQLPPNQFTDVIRFIKRASMDRVSLISSAVKAAMEKAGMKSNLTKAIPGVPDGSDTFNTRSLITWIGGPAVKSRKAKRQLVAIDATASARLEA